MANLFFHYRNVAIFDISAVVSFDTCKSILHILSDFESITKKRVTQGQHCVIVNQKHSHDIVGILQWTPKKRYSYACWELLVVFCFASKCDPCFCFASKLQTKLELKAFFLKIIYYSYKKNIYPPYMQVGSMPFQWHVLLINYICHVFVQPIQ